MSNWTRKPVSVTCPLKSIIVHQHENTLEFCVGPPHRLWLTSGYLVDVICGRINMTKNAKLNVRFGLQFWKSITRMRSIYRWSWPVQKINTIEYPQLVPMEHILIPCRGADEILIMYFPLFSVIWPHMCVGESSRFQLSVTGMHRSLAKQD
jgi:hypothetical protein